MLLARDLKLNFDSRRHTGRRRALVRVNTPLRKGLVISLDRESMGLRLDVAIRPSTPVSVEISTCRLPALVEWYEDGYAGLRLANTLDDDTIAMLTGTPPETRASP